MSFLKRSTMLLVFTCVLIFSSVAVNARLSEYIVFTGMFGAPDQIEVELTEVSMIELLYIEFEYAGGSFDTYGPSGNGIFDPGTSAEVASITINGQTVYSGNSGTVTLPSGNQITLEVNY